MNNRFCLIIAAICAAYLSFWGWAVSVIPPKEWSEVFRQAYGSRWFIVPSIASIAATATGLPIALTRAVTLQNRFWMVIAQITAAYLAFWAAMIAATATYTSPLDVWKVLISREIQYSTMLSLVTCTASALMSLLLAVPIGYLMSRRRFPGHAMVDAALDIPIVLPPMVVGICLLIFFQTRAGQLFERIVPLTYTIGGVIVAQFVIAAAFAIRTMRSVFDHLSPRPEDVAMTLGCTRWQAFRHVTLPAARRGMFAAGSIAWARSLGEFGPILVFAGATRMRTEVLPTSVWLAWSVGDLEQGVAVSLLMIVISMIILIAIRMTKERA